MKKSLFSLILLSLSLTACQNGSRLMPVGAQSQLRAQAPQVSQLRAATTRSTKPYTIEDFRFFLAGKLFETLDQNRDQAVTPQEFARLLDKAAVARFAQLDANQDGRLAAAELQAGKNQVFSPRYSEATLREKLTAFFQTQDLNHDGFVAGPETKGSLNLIFDYDHDNRFSLDEFVDATSSLLHLAQAKTDEFLKVHLG